MTGLSTPPLPQPSEAEPHALYRFYDADGALLYIGITGDLTMRWKQHGKRQPWWPKVAQATIEHFDSKAEAAAAEKAAIKAEKPAWNVVGTDKQRQRAKVEAWKPTPVAGETWITLAEAHRILAPLEISMGTVRNWADRGTLRMRRLGPGGKSGHRRVGKSSAEAALARFAPDLTALSAES